MLKFLSLTMFYMFTIMCLCVKSMFFLWVLLEINMVYYMLLVKNINQTMTNSMMKYFIIQSMSSTMLLMLLMMKNHNIINENTINMVMMIIMMMKMGMFPLSNWYFQISENMNWNMYIYLNSLQKIMPLTVIFYCLPSFYFSMFLIMINSFYSVTEMWMQLSLRWLMNCSSLNHMSWIIFSMYLNNFLWEIYFMVYMYLLIMMYFYMKMFNINTIFNWISLNKPKFIMINFMIIIMNFMGLPPFLGFLPKLLILMNMKFSMVLVIIMMNNIMLSYMYMYINLNVIMKNMIIKINFTNKYDNLNSNFLLLMTPLLMIMLSM